MSSSSKWLCVIVALITTAFIIGSFAFGYGLGRDKEHLESIKAVAAQKMASEKECTRLQHITTSVDNDLQKDLSVINGRLTSGLMRPSTCVYVAGNSPSSHATGGNKHAGQYGIGAQWLRGFAAEAETYRVKVKACQQLLIKERE